LSNTNQECSENPYRHSAAGEESPVFFSNQKKSKEEILRTKVLNDKK